MTAPQEPTDDPCDLPVATAELAVQDPTDLPAVAARLITTIERLTKSIGDLLERTERSEEQIADSRRQTRWQWVTIGVIAVLLAVSAWTTYQQVQTSRTLCPIFAVWLGAYNPDTRAPGRDRETYVATFPVMSDGYSRLGCTNPLVPPPATRPTAPQ